MQVFIARISVISIVFLNIDITPTLDHTLSTYLGRRQIIGNGSHTTQETKEEQSTKTRNPDVKGYMCSSQRQITSSHARDSESCSKQSCAKSWPTIKSTHKLIIYAYHATTNQLNTQATTNHKCEPNTNQASDRQSSKWPKSPLVNKPYAPIYPTHSSLIFL